MKMEQKLKLKNLRKKTILMTNMSDIINKLFEIMKKHIGEENRISKMSLFKLVYGVECTSIPELHEWILYELLKRSMHRMRQSTKCFIVSKRVPSSQYSSRNQGVWNYWVAKTESDYVVYRDNINRNIKAMVEMTKKCKKAVEQQWYKEEWTMKKRG